jgi:hypothetical protein
VAESLELPLDPEERARRVKQFWVEYKQQISALPTKEERLRCVCGNEHFLVTRVDFTCTVCFKSYRD